MREYKPEDVIASWKGEPIPWIDAGVIERPVLTVRVKRGNATHTVLMECSIDGDTAPLKMRGIDCIAEVRLMHQGEDGTTFGFYEVPSAKVTP